MREGKKEEWIRAEIAAERIGCTRSAVYRYVKAGILRRVCVAGKSYDLYAASDIPAVIAFRYDPDKKRKAAKKRKPAAFTQYRVEAVCPRCGQHHFSNRRWEGNGVPRYFCPTCAQRAEICASAWQNAATF